MDELALRTLLNIFTWFVVVGLAFDLFVIIKEFRDDWGEFRYGQIHPYENHLPRRPRISLLILALFGTALIVIGVAGELYVDVQAGKIETQIRGANDELLGLIIQEAGDAKTSAKTAHEELDAVKQKADVINVQLANASRQLTKLNDDLIAQGPRWKALEHGQSEFITALKPFPGQRLTVMICGQDDSERSPFEQKLMDLARKSGWAAPEYKAWQGCPTYLTGLYASSGKPKGFPDGKSPG